MLKKMTIPVLLALILSLVLSNTALAASDSPKHGRIGRRGMGTVVSAGDGKLAIETQKGESLTLSVDEKTILRTYEAEAIALSDLQAGDKVVVVATHQQGGWLARLVIRVPADFDPKAERLGRFCRGEVTAVDLAAGTITLKNKAGEETTFQTDAATVYVGILESLQDVTIGEPAFVLGMARPDGTLVALVVGKREQLQRYGGKVVDVNPASDSFTVKTRSGEVLTFQVDENTRYRSRENKINNLANLKPGMLVLVAARELEDGTLQAVLVLAGDLKDLPDVDIYETGRVTEVGSDNFTILAWDGATLTFQVSEQTRFFSKGQKVQSLADLKAGMRVFVGANQAEDGSFLAQGLLVLPPPRR